jgi:DNA-3-methyladenine glycosylase II
MYTKAFKHLKKDPVMNFLIEKYHDKISLDSYRSTNYALSLSNLIIDQQISFKAAITIKKRFAVVIQNLSYVDILNLDNDKIQSIGISFRKVEYIKNVFSFFIENEKRFIELDAEKMKKELISIKGIGKWTIEMFLMFELGKPDIFSKGDIALINSVKKNYKMNDLDNKKLEDLIKSWSPYNSTASLLLWKSIEEKLFFN